MRVLAIGAHPDDLEFRMAGTLRLYAERGDEVYMVIVTNGNIGSTRHETKAEVAEMRHKEAQAAADMIGAKELMWLNYEDEFLFDTEETRLRMIDCVRKAQPDVMFAPPYLRDYNPDHDVTGYLAFIARINAGIPLIKTDHEPTKKIPPMFCCVPNGMSYTNFAPDHFVDITRVWEKKLEIARCHKSQCENWSNDFFGYSSIKKFEAENRYFASQCGTPGVEFVEAFMNQRTFPMIAGAYKFLP